MTTMKNMLVENKCVLLSAKKIIYDSRGGQPNANGDEEERKEDIVEIQMQNLEGAGNRGSKNGAGAMMGATQKNEAPQREQIVPLLSSIPGHVSINYMMGTISKDEQFRFKKMLFRATRGKAIVYFDDLKQEELKDYTGAMYLELRTAFVIVY